MPRRIARLVCTQAEYSQVVYYNESQFDELGDSQATVLKQSGRTKAVKLTPIVSVLMLGVLKPAGGFQRCIIDYLLFLLYLLKLEGVMEIAVERPEGGTVRLGVSGADRE